MAETRSSDPLILLLSIACDTVLNSFVHYTIAPQRLGWQINAADDLVEAALKVGVAQLMFSNTAPYAAVSETVEVLRMHRKVKVK